MDNPTSAGEEVKKVLVERSLLEGMRWFFNKRFDGDRLLKYQLFYMDEIDKALAASPPPSARSAEQLREALRVLYEETADYIRINHLGDVHHNRSMQMARDALGIASSSLGEEKMTTSANLVMGGEVYRCPACKMPLSGTPESHLPNCVIRKATEENLRNNGWTPASAPDAPLPRERCCDNGNFFDGHRCQRQPAAPDAGQPLPRQERINELQSIIRNGGEMPAPSAPASAAREQLQELAETLRRRFNDPKHRKALRAEDEAYQDGTTAIFDTLWLEVAETVTQVAAEQTRQLREELANWPKTLCAVTAMGDEETAEEVADFIADMTNTCMERLRFGKEQQQRAQAAEAELKLEQEASATVAENYGRVCDKLKAAEAERDKLLKYARHTGMCFLEQTRREPCNCGWAELERLRKEAE